MSAYKQAKANKGRGRTRRARGLYTAGDYAAPTLKRAFAKRGFAQARILTEWSLVAGQGLADVCRPERVSRGKSGFGGTLVLATLGAYALEIQHQEPQIVERINRYYGYKAVSKLSIRQVAELPGQKQPDFSPPAASAEEAGQVEKLVAPVAHAGIRGALEQLGKNVLARQREQESRNP